MILDEPCRKACREDVQGDDVATQKKEELKHVEAQKGIPEPAVHRSLWLRGVADPRDRGIRKGEGRLPGDGTGAYLYSPIGRADPHGVCGWVPPYSNVLCSPDQGVDISDTLMKRDHLMRFLESKRWLNLERDRQDKPGAAQATYRGDEEVGSLLPGTRHARPVGQQERQGNNMGGDNAVIDARSVRSGSDDAAERLVGDGAHVDHGESVLGKLRMEDVEGDTRFCDDIALVDVDLCMGKGELRVTRRKGGIPLGAG